MEEDSSKLISSFEAFSPIGDDNRKRSRKTSIAPAWHEKKD
jgi:hypothetical protein